MRRRPLSMVCLMVIVLLYLGTRLAGSLPSSYEEEGRRITVTGRVYRKEDTVKAGKERKVLYLHRADAAPKGENIICYLKADQKLPEIGSIVKVRGTVKNFQKASNPGQFDAESYYHILKISFQLNQTEIQEKSDSYHIFSERLYQIRAYFSAVFDHSLSEEDASLMKTMLLGEKGAADDEKKALYQRNGIAHVLAVSGLHVSLLGMTLYKLLKKLGLPAAVRTGLPAGMIVLYGFMTGFSVSSLRAVFMFGLHMLALLCKRTYDMITAAFLCAALLLLDQPLYLYNSSFLFSFGCIFTILFLVPALTKEIKSRERQPGIAAGYFLSGAAVTMGGIPLQLAFFYQLPLYSTFLNLLVIPLMSLLLPGGIFLLVFHKIPVIGEMAVSLITGILAVYESGCRLAEKLPFHMVTLGKPEAMRVVIYLLILSLSVLLQNRLLLRRRWALVLLGAALLFLPGKRELTVTFLDVGQGDCIHIETMEGNHYLVDGGSTSVSRVGTYRILPYLKFRGVQELQAVFVTHPDEDHYNGILSLMQEGKEQGITIKRLYLPEISESSRTEAYEELIGKAERAGIKTSYISKGKALTEEEFTLLCLHPERNYESRETNELSTVLLLQFRGFQALLTGDVEGDGEKELLQSLAEIRTGSFEGITPQKGGITVLKAAHHGSSGATKEEMLAALSPAYTVISCGKDNSYGHPHRELLERLERSGSEIMVTYMTGAVTFHTDGKYMWAEEFLH